MSRRILFVGGQIVLPDRVVDGSLLVENEKIVGILEPEIQTHIENCEIVDVTGKTLLPGLIDTHVHMWDPSPLNSVSYTHLRAHETGRNLVCRLLLEKKKYPHARKEGTYTPFPSL